MIAVDTSALMAIGLDEPEAESCIAVLEAEDNVLISAGTLAEVLIVAARRNISAEVSGLIEGLGFEVVSVTAAAARRISQAYQQWGKASIRQASISAIVSLMKWRRHTAAACYTSAVILPRRISRAQFRKAVPKVGILWLPILDDFRTFQFPARCDFWCGAAVL